MHKKGLRDSVTAGDVVLHEGWLKKQSSGKFQQWHKRYFRLSGHYLTYFADETTDEVKGACDLSTVTLCVHEELCIRMTAPGEELLVRSASAEDAEKWQTSLLLACDAQQQPTAARFTNGGQQQDVAAPGIRTVRVRASRELQFASPWQTADPSGVFGDNGPWLAFDCTARKGDSLITGVTVEPTAAGAASADIVQLSSGTFLHFHRGGDAPALVHIQVYYYNVFYHDACTTHNDDRAGELLFFASTDPTAPPFSRAASSCISSEPPAAVRRRTRRAQTRQHQRVLRRRRDIRWRSRTVPVPAHA